jgi:hypothetical protein
MLYCVLNVLFYVFVRRSVLNEAVLSLLSLFYTFDRPIHLKDFIYFVWKVIIQFIGRI